MKTYTILPGNVHENPTRYPVLNIDSLHHTPQDIAISAFARLSYDEKGLHVSLWATESEIRAEEQPPLGAPWYDSCLELFIRPMENEKRYINIEISPTGCIFLGIGTSIHNLIRLIPGEPVIKPVIEYTEDGWSVRYSVPWSFLQMFFPSFDPQPGTRIRANCYKCGDMTAIPHFFAWNPVDDSDFTFHCPQHFGTMILG